MSGGHTTPGSRPGLNEAGPASTVGPSDFDVDELRRRSLTAEALSVASQQLLLAADGEELSHLRGALTAVASSLGATRSHHVQIHSPHRNGNRRHLSVASDDPDQAERDRLSRAIVEQGDLAATTTVLRLDHPAADGSDGHKDVDEDELEWAIAPMTRGAAIDEALCVGRSSARRWRDWELAALRSLADIFPKVRRRMAAESQFAAMFHLAPTAISLRDMNGDLVSCNQAFLDFMGLESEATVIGTGALEFIASEAMTDEIRFQLRYIAARGYPPIELPYRHAVRDEVIWGRVSSAYLGEDHGGQWIVHVEDATADVRSRGAVHQRATRDSLTGLANRYALLDALDAHLGMDACSAHPASGSGTARLHACGVVLLDLDGFKPVNDTLGHAAGDEILIEVGRRLRAAVQTKDLVGRYGGDEFLVLLPGLGDDAQMQALSDRLEAIFDDPFFVAGQQVTLAGSFGFSRTLPGETTADVIARADAAMYREKARRYDRPALRIVDLDDTGGPTLIVDPSANDPGNKETPAARG